MSSIDPVEQIAGYERWLETQPLAVSTRRPYRGHARRFVEFLATRPGEGGDPLTDAHARDYAVRDFKGYGQGKADSGSRPARERAGGPVPFMGRQPE